MIDVTNFVKELKRLGVEYDSINEKHWIGSKLICEDKHIITNKQMKTMCESYFGREYILLTNTQKTKVRIKIFKMLRGVQ